MAGVCKQITIEKPDVEYSNTVFFNDVPIPDVPETGARIRVFFAGACYTRRDSLPPESPLVPGVKDSSIFSGYEVAGLVDAVGSAVSSECNLKCGDKVVLYPYDDLTALTTGYAEYISITNTKYLVKVPSSVPLSVAATLPSGALWAMNAVNIIATLRSEQKLSNLRILIVGTGGLSLWLLRIASYYLGDFDDVAVVLAALKDDNIAVAQQHGKCDVISWSEANYESQLIERCKNVCDGDVDISLDYSTSPTQLIRIVKCMRKNGIIFMGPECAYLEPTVSEELKCKNIKLQVIKKGSLEQLQELIDLIADGKIIPPKHSVFPAENAKEVIQDLSKGKISGRAVLEFQKSE